jgi:hypothetical protein
MRRHKRFLKKHLKEKEVSILDTVLRRREPAAAYRTIDGGHPAPYPDMTDAQLYNYELAFNVPRKTFDRPPASVRRAVYETRPEPVFEPVMDDRRENDVAFDEPSAAGTAEARWQESVTRQAIYDEPASATEDGPTTIDIPPSENADDQAASPIYAEQHESQNHPIISDDTRRLDLSKPVRTITTKQPVEIITTRARHPIYKVHGYIDNDDIVTVFTSDGRLSEHGARFLENVPEQHELWLNIYPNRNAYSNDRYVVTQHETREEADAAASAERVGCVKADFNLNF